jgi:hypothetical protein
MADFWQQRLVVCFLLLVSLTGLWLVAGAGNVLQANGDQLTPPLTDNGVDNGLISDSLFLYASSVLSFDPQAFLDSQPGPLATYAETIDGRSWTAADSIQYNAMFYGLNPQLILILLEAQRQILTNPNAVVPSAVSTLSGSPSATSFHAYVKQLAEETSRAYDAHRYGAATTRLSFASNESLSLPDTPNAGTYAVQAILARSMSRLQWQSWVQGPRPLFVQRFSQWFGDSLLEPDQVLPAATAAPTGYMLPFPIGETWYYTGGPHYYGGGTPGCVSGPYCPRPWSSLDIAQPELIACPGANYPAQRWIVAAKSGQIIQSSQALIVIDHGDGWRTYYSHVATADKRGTGPVERGDMLGHPSCEVEPGGFTTGVHVHFALYQVGVGFVDVNGFSVSGWLIGETSHYNGTMQLAGNFREASTGRQAGVNDILNSGVGGVCPTAGGVLLYKHVNFDCDGDGPGSGYFQQSSIGFQDLPASFNDRASSVRIPSGWSVRLYEHRGRAGASVCRNADDPSFNGDYFEGSAITLNDHVSSIEVFDVADCSGPYAGGTWTTTYFGDLDLVNPCAEVTTQEGSYVFGDWGAEGPDPTCPADEWSARFTRYAYFRSGSYTFVLEADERARLKIDGQTVIDNWMGTGHQEASRTLSAGSYEVTVEYGDLLDSAYLAAWWRGPGYDVPRESQDPVQWYARYWGNRDLAGEPILLLNEGTGMLNRDWADEGPGYGLPGDRFSGHFERQALLVCGTYRFRLHSDDGARLWVDDQLLLDTWFKPVGEYEASIDLDSGFHQMQIEYHEESGAAAISLTWTHESFCPLPNAFYLPLSLHKAGD